jgi:hypothetical protein
MLNVIMLNWCLQHQPVCHDEQYRRALLIAELISNIQLPQTYDSLRGRLEAENGAETKMITAPFPKSVSVALLCETNFEGQSTTNRVFRILLYLQMTPNTRVSAVGWFWTFIELICHQTPQDEYLDRIKPA